MIGSAWVIDGYMRARVPVDVFMDVYDSNGYFLHTWLFPKSPEIPDAGTGHADVSIRPYTNDLKIIKRIWR